MSRNIFGVVLGALVGIIGMSQMPRGHAAEIRVISANGMREVLAETKAKFEADTRHQLTITVVETGEIRRRVLAGENFDVIMVPRATSDELEKAGKIAPGTAVQLIRVNFGLGVPNEGLKPDVSTPEALKNTFLRAKTVLITDPDTGGISGVHLMDVLNKLGIADEMKSRLVPQPGGGFHAARVVRGEADLAVQAEHEIRCVKGAMFLPFPPAFQRTIVFLGSVGAAAGDVAAAKAYLHYLTGSETDNTYSAHCLTRG
jgi:molybdate transport system substrate-binding protein